MPKDKFRKTVETKIPELKKNVTAKSEPLLKDKPSLVKPPIVKPPVVKPPIIKPPIVISPLEEQRQLEYLRLLKKNGKNERQRFFKPRVKTLATPYIFIPDSATDNGARSTQTNSTAIYRSHGIRFLDKNKNTVPIPQPKEDYYIQVDIKNIGAVGCYSGMIEIYFAETMGFEKIPFCYGGFTVLPGKTTTFTSPKRIYITPESDMHFMEDFHIILVHTYDPFCDDLTNPFDIKDRHVARFDGLNINPFHDAN